MARGHTKLTPEAIAKAYELAKQGLPNKSIAAGIGVSYTQFWEWRKNAKTDQATDLEVDLSEAMRAGSLAGEKALLAKLQTHADNDSRAATWLLSHSPKWRDTWSEASRTRQEVGRVVDMFVAALNDDETLTPAQRERVLLVVKAKGLAVVSSDVPEE
tara:strand:- start:361 stop:834 length:474 start_codon:yes stop_codon:yes gene_type:complete